MQNKLLITAGVVLIVIGLLYALNIKPGNLSEEAVVSNLVSNWQTFEKTIPDRPVLGATDWNYPSIIQIISSDKLLVEYDDGHIVKYSVVSYAGKNNFAFVENVGKVNELSSDDWNLVELKYGNTSGAPVTFKHSPPVLGGTPNASDWKKVNENPFTGSAPVAQNTSSGNSNTVNVSNNSNPTVSSVKIAFLLDREDSVYRGNGVIKGCDKVVLVDRKISPTNMPLNAALKLLFNDRTPWPYRPGVPGNFVGGRPDLPLTFSKATLENGVAKVYLYGNVGLAGVCDDPRLTSQVEQTAFQFPSVKSVKIYVNDKEWITPNLKGI